MCAHCAHRLKGRARRLWGEDGCARRHSSMDASPFLYQRHGTKPLPFRARCRRERRRDRWGRLRRRREPAAAAAEQAPEEGDLMEGSD